MLDTICLLATRFEGQRFSADSIMRTGPRKSPRKARIKFLRSTGVSHADLRTGWKWSRAVRARLQDAGLRVIQTPYRAPNANAYAERFVRSIKEECLDRLIPIGERHFRRAVAEFVAHYHRERNHPGLGTRLIERQPTGARGGSVRRCSRLGGRLNYYARAG